jgi:hypothetical protein
MMAFMSARSPAMPIGWMFLGNVSATGPDSGPPEDPSPKTAPRRGCTVYSAENLYEAHLVLDLLEEAGIAARLFNEHLIGAMGELPFLESSPRIWLLDEADLRAARVLVDGYEARRKVPIRGTRRCPACSEESPDNFELCWSCRAPLDSAP